MAKTLKKVMAVLLACLVTATAPVNVSAAAASEDGHVVFGGYGQRSSCEVQFDKSITSIVGYGRQADIDVSGTIKLKYQWDEGYDSEFTSGSGYAEVDSAVDGLSVEVRHIKTTGRTILFKIILSNGENEIGSADISYYVDTITFFDKASAFSKNVLIGTDADGAPIEESVLREILSLPVSRG